MTVDNLREALAHLPGWMYVRVLLEPAWFPDGVDLNDCPGYYRIADVKAENIGGQAAVIHLDPDQQPRSGGTSES